MFGKLTERHRKRSCLGTAALWSFLVLSGTVQATVRSQSVIDYEPFEDPSANFRPVAPTILLDMRVRCCGKPAAYGDRVAVYGANSQKCLAVSTVITTNGLVSIPLYVSDTSERLSVRVWNRQSGLDEPEIFSSLSTVAVGEVGEPVTGLFVSTAADRTPVYTVTYDLDGKSVRTGGGALEQSVSFGFPSLAPTVSCLSGYVFRGWDTEDRDDVRRSMVVRALYDEVDLLPLYAVIDLSGGPTASDYPVTGLDDVPSGGWTDEYKTTKLVLRRIEAGSFVMGSPASELGRGSDETQHEVSLSKGFYAGVFEVTQRQYELITGRNPSDSSALGPTRPVTCVDWDAIRGSGSGIQWPLSEAVDANSFLARLRAKAGLPGIDLPTEAQWEYACRAGTGSALNNGSDLSALYLDANMGKVGRYGYNNGWKGGSCDGRSGYPSRTTAVGSYLPNNWGLYDMHGNAGEWCLDRYVGDLGSAAATDPRGGETGIRRVIRGGEWWGSACMCRSAHRNWGENHGNRDFDGGSSTGQGFRLFFPSSDILSADNPYRVRFHRNDGSDETDDQLFSSGISDCLSWAVSGLGWTRTGHAMTGWAISPSQTVATYANGERVADIAAPGKTLNLYALWKPSSSYSYKVQFHAMDGTGRTYDQTFAKDEAKCLAWLDSVLKWSRSGYIFCGWSTVGSSRVCNYNNGSKVSNLTLTPNGTVHLYAVWLSGTSHRIIFHRNLSATDTLTRQEVFWAGTEQTLAYLESQLGWNRKGYTFAGWAKTRDATAAQYANGQKVKDLSGKGKTLNLYALWRNNATGSISSFRKGTDI